MKRLVVLAVRSVSHWPWWSEWTGGQILIHASNLDDRWETGVFEWVEITKRAPKQQGDGRGAPTPRPG